LISVKVAALRRRYTYAMDHELLKRYGGAVPRYTSYPTAPHFHAGVSAATYRDWLGAL